MIDSFFVSFMYQYTIFHPTVRSVIADRVASPVVGSLLETLYSTMSNLTTTETYAVPNELNDCLDLKVRLIFFLVFPQNNRN